MPGRVRVGETERESELSRGRKSKSPPCRTERDKGGATAILNRHEGGAAPFASDRVLLQGAVPAFVVGDAG
jgi:hypothetical protein